jgi:tetratricopeptide (TPR) repeat protein
MRRPFIRLIAFAGVTLLGYPWIVAEGQGDSAVRVLLREGDSAYAAGARALAVAAYGQAIARDSSASSRAVYRLAVLLAEDGAFAGAIALHRLYARMEPNDVEGALGQARTYGWAGRTDDALAIYREVLTREPDYRAAALGAGQVLAWAGRYAESVATYRDWIRRRPEDRDAGLAMARTLAWWGGAHLRDAERLYDSLRTSDGDMEARKGLALVAAWQGDLVRSERIWRELTDEAPNDAEVWTGLAQVLRWRGQPFNARDALNRALAIEPTHRDARSQRRWLDAELSPLLHLRAVSTGDSDDNKAQTYFADVSLVPLRDLSVRLEAVHVNAQFAAERRTSQTARGNIMLRLPWGEGDWRGRIELGVNRRPNETADAPTHTRTVGQVAVSGQMSTRLSGELRAGRGVLDETVSLIAGGIHTTTVEADVATQLGDRLNVSGAVSSGAISSDSARNARVAASIGARWSLSHGRSFGLVLRTFRHEREAREGYFSPRRYEHLELNARARRGRDLGWVLAGDAGFGLQRIDYRGSRTTQPTQRLSGSISFVWAPGLEWSFSGALANVATAVTSSASGYRYGSLSLGGRVPLR